MSVFLRVSLFFTRVVGRPVNRGPRPVLGALGGVEQAHGHVGEDLLHPGQRVNGAGRQQALGAQGAFQGLGQAVGMLAGLERGRPKGAASTSKVGYVFISTSWTLTGINTLISVFSSIKRH